MPITIGAKKQADFNDPLGLLTDCHRRIEHFLNLLVTVTSQARGAELVSEQREAVETALRYFNHAAPKHTRDEEDSLFPRMYSAPDKRAKNILQLLQSLSVEHDGADGQHRQIDSLFSRWISEGALSDEDSNRLTETLNDLTNFYEKHIAAEEQEVFPLAAQVLTAEEIKALGSEMAQRRGVDLKLIGAL